MAAAEAVEAEAEDAVDKNMGNAICGMFLFFFKNLNVFTTVLRPKSG